jgi:hypothetical protein
MPSQILVILLGIYIRIADIVPMAFCPTCAVGTVEGVGCGSWGFKPKLMRSESSRGGVRKYRHLKSRIQPDRASKASLHWAFATGVRVVPFWTVSRAALAASLRVVSFVKAG